MAERQFARNQIQETNIMQHVTLQGFHTHIYFDSATRDSAAELREAIIRHFGTEVSASRLVDQSVGPHPMPMFEVDFAPETFASFVPWLMLNHGVHSALVHPVTGDDLRDHRDFPIWIGKQLPLNLSIF